MTKPPDGGGQLSVAEAVPSVASRLVTVTLHDVAPAPVNSVFAAGGVTTGGVLSVTVTVCVSCAVLPTLSVTVYVIIVLPTGKILPTGTPVRVTTKPAQLSLAVAVPSVASLTNVPHELALGPVKAVTSAGASIVGMMLGLSFTLTVCVPVVVLPAESVAVYVTIVVPVGNTKLSHVRFGSPGAGHATLGMPVRLMFTEELQLSSAVATN